jgi:membrane protein
VTAILARVEGSSPSPDTERPPIPRGLRLVRRVVRGLFMHHAFDHAATMAFYFFLGTIPLMVLGGLLIGFVVERQGAEALTAPIYKALPGVASELLRTALTDINEAPAGSLAPVSLIGFLWLTSNGFHNLMDVFELLIGATPRPWWKQRLIAIAWVVATLSTAFLSVWFLLVTMGWTDGIDNASQMPLFFRRMRGGLAYGWQSAGVVVVFGSVMMLGVAAFYRVAVVHPSEVRRHVWSGTIVAIVLWTIVTWAFGAYVRTIAHYAVYYGSLATVAVTLLWFYLSSLAFVVGAEVNAQLEGVREPMPSAAL